MDGARPRSWISRLAVGLVACTALSPASTAAELTRIVASVDAATAMGSTPLRDRDLLTVRLDGGSAQVLPALGDLLPAGVDIDALSLLEDNRVVFSTNVTFDASGVRADDEDLVLYDRGSLSLVFDGSDLGLPESADLDAAHVESLAPLEVYYSVDAPVEVGSIGFADDDIIRFDGTGHVLFRSGASMLGDEAARANLDALWVDPSRNEITFSLDVAIETGPGRTAAEAGDLVLWANGSLLMCFDASAAGIEAAAFDLDAVDFDTAFFADDFETGDTSMWSTTTP